MPKIVDFQAADEPRDVVHQIVQALAEGKLVGLPTETGYVAAAHPLNSTGSERLAELAARLSAAQPDTLKSGIGKSGIGRLVVVLKHPQESLDYVPEMGLLGRKLTRRFWPGPVTLLFERSDDAAQNGLASALPASVSRELYAANGLALRLPAHELTWSVLRLLPSPLVATGENHGADHHAVENQTGENRMGGTCYATAAALAAAAGDALDMVVDVGAPRYDLPTTLVRVGHDRWEVVSEGVASRRTLNRLAGNMYLFVCTGNTCRSPMAEGLFRKLLSEKLKCPEDELVDRGYMVVSAGVAAAPGQPPSPEGVEILGERGVDLRGHESQPVTPQLLSQADHIFTMTRSHRDLLVREFPDTASSVRLLARNGSDVIDPIGSGMEEYRRCADQIETELQRIVTELPTGS